jgi:hypothetical protein
MRARQQAVELAHALERRQGPHTTICKPFVGHSGASELTIRAMTAAAEVNVLVIACFCCQPEPDSCHSSFCL